MAEKKYQAFLYFNAPLIQIKIDDIEEAEALMAEYRVKVFGPEYISTCEVKLSSLVRNPLYKKE